MKPLILTLLLMGAALASTRPQLVSSIPAQGQDGVVPTSPITLVFSAPMDSASLNAANAFTIYDLTTGESASSASYFTATPSADGLTVSLRFWYFNLVPANAYRLDINAAVIKDRSGNLLVPVPPVLFDTFPHPDKSAPQVVGTVPADGETGVAINSGMYIVFDRPIAALNYDSGITVTAEGPVSFISKLAGDRILQISTALLLPGNSRISVSVTGIIDRNGNPLPAAAVFSFQTGVLTDVLAQALKFAPPSGSPLSLPLHLTFAKPVDAPLLAAGSVMFQSYRDYGYGDSYAATFTLSGDRRSLTVNANQLLPGSYILSVSIPFDRTTGKLNAFVCQVTIGVSADSTPVKLLAASPPDGATNVPVTAPLRLEYTRPIDIAGTPGAVSLSANGNPVDGDFSVDSTGVIVTFKSRKALQPSTSYTISVPILNDFAGNTAAPYSASFTTRVSGGYTDSFNVISIVPAGGATSVDPSTAIVLTFSHPVDPVSLSGSYAVVLSDSNGSVAADYSVNGAVVTVQPRRPLSNGNVGVSCNCVTDLGGAMATNFVTSFQVSGAQADTTAPRVVAVSPADGQTVMYSSAHVELEFSKPMSTLSLSAILPGSYEQPQRFVAYQDGLTPIALKLVVISNSRIALEFSAPPDTTITLLTTDGIVDYAGNHLVPFRTTVHTSSKQPGYGAHVIQQYVTYQFSPAPMTSGIVTYWSAPLDRQSVEQNCLIYTADGLVPGTFQWTADSQAFAFVPSAPFSHYVIVNIFVLPPAHDAAGLPITFNTSFGADPITSPSSTALAVTGSSFTSPAPLNLVFDTQFNQDVPDSLLQTATVTFGLYQKPQSNCPLRRVRSNVIRCAPPLPLLANTRYSYAFDFGGSAKSIGMFTTGDNLVSSTPTVIAAGPVGNNVAQNSSVVVLFSEGVSLGTVKLLSNGVEVATLLGGTTPQSLVLHPFPFLQPATAYTVVVTGFEDAGGFPVPDRTWTFTTGSGIDNTPPTLLRIQPSGSNVSTDAIPSFTYDRAIAPDMSTFRFGFFYGPPDSSQTVPVPYTLGFSDDLRTIYLKPNAPLAVGATVTFSTQVAQDFSGNLSGTPYYATTASTFQVSQTAAGPATVTATNPPQNATGAPLNTSIQIQSSANLTQLGGVVATLAENGNAIDSSSVIGNDGHTLTITPVRPLAAASAIDVTVTGIAGDPYRFSFSTGSDPDVVAPSVSAWPAAGMSPVSANVAVHLRFNEPLNPFTVNTASITLHAPNQASIDAAVTLDDTGTFVTLTPKLPLAEEQQYTANWSVADWAGNKSTGNTYFTVGPPGSSAPTLIGIDPADGSADVSVRPSIQAFFTNPVELTRGNDSFRLLQDGVAVPGTLIINGPKISFAPARDLLPGTTYRVELSGAVDAFGNAIPDAASSFTVATPGTTLTPLKLLSTMPANGAVGVPANTPIRLTFNKPVTTGSAQTFKASVNYYGYSSPSPYISTHVEGNDVVIQTAVPFSSGSAIYVQGSVQDNAGYLVSVGVSFTAAPLADVTQPTLEYTFPGADSNIPFFGTNLVLRFSKPVILGPNAIRLIGGSGTYTPNWSLAKDGRTVSSSPDLVPASDVTVAVTSDLTDFAGNAIAPVSYTLHVLSVDATALPKVASITPPAGAIGVAVDATIQLQFTHAMDPVSVGLGLLVTADGVPITGSLTASSDGQTIVFTPDLQFAKGAVIATSVGRPADDLIGQEVGPFNSSFTVIKDAASQPQPTALFASASAVDVRFDAPLGRYSTAPYIRSGFERIPSHWELPASDWLRIVPDAPLELGRLYRLVLDGRTEFPLRLAPAAPEPATESATYDGRVVRIRFDEEINPLTLDTRTVQLTRPDGAPVPYFLETTVDRREAVLRSAWIEPVLIVTVNGAESSHGIVHPWRQFRVVVP